MADQNPDDIEAEELEYISIPTLLVCAPSGTGLTGVGKKLVGVSGVDGESNRDPAPSVAVFDLETELCKNISDTRLTVEPGREHPDMREVLFLPRGSVLDAWDATCKRILRMPVGSASLRVVFLHLTWYHADTSEFFSPINARLFLGEDSARAGDGPACDVRQVILLIDDVYDMFLRLQKDGDLYEKENIDRDADLLKKLRKFLPMDKPYRLSEGDQERIYEKRLRLESTEMALMQLIHWRRAEMMHAENLARTLGAEFTLLGTKHSWESVWYVVERPATPKTYLSHRISEVRRKNKAVNALPGVLGDWEDVADEVNDLHQEFLKHRQLLINPTAIDELRFDDLEPWRPEPPDEGESDRGDEGESDRDPVPLLSRGQSPLLARRWPLPKNTPMLWSQPGGDAPATAPQEVLSPDDASVQHTELLKGGLDLHDPVSSAVARSLARQIYFDIAARDHMIVEHTPGLCVYRPFFSTGHSEEGKGADWSSGVEREIDHWRKKVPGEAQPRAALVHTRPETMARLQWLNRDKRFEKLVIGAAGRLLRKKLREWRIPTDAIEALFDGSIVRRKSSQLGRGKREQTIPYRAAEILKYIETYALLCVRHIFTRLDNPEPADDAPKNELNVEVFLAEEGDDHSVVGLEELAKSLCTFFGGGRCCKQRHEKPVEPPDPPEDFWDALDKAFAEVFGPRALSDLLRRRVSELTLQELSEVFFDVVPEVPPEVLSRRVSELSFEDASNLLGQEPARLILDEVADPRQRRVSQVHLADMSGPFQKKVSELLHTMVADSLGIPLEGLKEEAAKNPNAG